ncbi:MAG: hypothetical protein H8D47_04270 [Planctomycetes bacterium]|nr:hypothetical protein [Planctomycetota bacterium]
MYESKKLIILSISLLLICFIASIPVFAEENTAEQTKISLAFVKLADFYLRDGTFVNGRLLEEDKNKIIVESLDGSKLVVQTFGKKQIDSRTLNIKSTFEYNYYLSLAEYFAAKTWDFENDPDDFIQAIRSYEKAQLLIAGTSREDDDIAKIIPAKITQLKADRDIWIEQTKTRSELRKLEFEATFEQKFEKLEQKLNDSVEQVDSKVKKIDDIADDVLDQQDELRKGFINVSDDLVNRMDRLEVRLEDTKNLIYSYRRYYPGYWKPKEDNK